MIYYGSSFSIKFLGFLIYQIFSSLVLKNSQPDAFLDEEAANSYNKQIKNRFLCSPKAIPFLLIPFLSFDSPSIFSFLIHLSIQCDPI